MGEGLTGGLQVAWATGRGPREGAAAGKEWVVHKAV